MTTFDQIAAAPRGQEAILVTGTDAKGQPILERMDIVAWGTSKNTDRVHPMVFDPVHGAVSVLDHPGLLHVGTRVADLQSFVGKAIRRLQGDDDE